MEISKRVRSNKKHHRTEWSHNGERTRVESCWFWECACGAAEAASTKREAQREWARHLEWIRKCDKLSPLFQEPDHCEHEWKWEQGCEDWEEYWKCDKCGDGKE